MTAVVESPAHELSKLMRAGSRAEHTAAESSDFIERLLDGRADREEYATYLHRLAAVGGSPPGAAPLVYWHGGAFINGIAKQHWGLIDHLATATGRDVLVPEYGLAPDHHVGEALCP